MHQKDSLINTISTLVGKDKLDGYYELSRLLYAYEKETSISLKYFEDYQKEAHKQKNYEEEAVSRQFAIGYLSNKFLHSEVVERALDDLKFMEEQQEWARYFSTSDILVKAYLNLGQQEKGLKELHRMYEKSKQIKEYPEGVSQALYSMGCTYLELRRFDEGEIYLKQALDISKKEKIQPFRIHLYSKLTEAYLTQSKTKDAQKLLATWESDMSLFDKSFPPDPILYEMFYRKNLMLYETLKDFDKGDYYSNLLENSPLTTTHSIYDVYYYRMKAANIRKDWTKLLEYGEKGYIKAIEIDHLQGQYIFLKAKSYAYIHLGKPNEACDAMDSAFTFLDSIKGKEFNAQLDEIRTQYEVDKITEENGKIRNYMYFAIGISILLVIALSIWIYYSRLVTMKNRAIVLQIKGMRVQQEKIEAEILKKTSFDIEEGVEEEDGFCPQSRKDKLCIAIRDAILKDKIYRNTTISRDTFIDSLGVNKDLFSEAFQYCFDMPFTEYINFLRLKDAITLLEQSDLSIEEISEKVGFGSVRTFQRQFLAKYNMPPKDYRKATKE